MAAMKLLIIAMVATAAQASEVRANANPIRKVVTMLQNMQAKVTAQGEKDQELFDKYMCYCKSAGGDLQTGVDAAGSKIPELQSSIEGAKAQKAQLKEDLKGHQTDRDAAKAAMAAATALREKEAAAFAASK